MHSANCWSVCNLVQSTSGNLDIRAVKHSSALDMSGLDKGLLLFFSLALATDFPQQKQFSIAKQPDAIIIARSLLLWFCGVNVGVNCIPLQREPVHADTRPFLLRADDVIHPCCSW